MTENKDPSKSLPPAQFFDRVIEYLTIEISIIHKNIDIQTSISKGAMYDVQSNLELLLTYIFKLKILKRS